MKRKVEGKEERLMSKDLGFDCALKCRQKGRICKGDVYFFAEKISQQGALA